MKFYPSNWRADPGVRASSLAARGFWMECLFLMHESVRRGYLLIAGRAPSDRDLAVQMGVTVGEVKRYRRELLEKGVAAQTEEGVWFSRKMVRDEIRRRNGAHGGNPALLPPSSDNREPPSSDNREPPSSDNREPPSSDNRKPPSSDNRKPPSPARVRDRARPPQARSQKLEARKNTDLLARFARWYSIYPVHKARDRAEKTWLKLRPDDDLTARMIDAVERQKRERADAEARGEWQPAWKYPASWLNGKCWDDDTTSDAPTEPVQSTIPRDPPSDHETGEFLAGRFGELWAGTTVQWDSALLWIRTPQVDAVTARRRDVLAAVRELWLPGSIEIVSADYQRPHPRRRT